MRISPAPMLIWEAPCARCEVHSYSLLSKTTPFAFQGRAKHLLSGGSSLRIIQFSVLPGTSVLARETYSCWPKMSPISMRSVFLRRSPLLESLMENQPCAPVVSLADFPNSQSQVQSQSLSQGSVYALKTPSVHVSDEEWVRGQGRDVLSYPRRLFSLCSIFQNKHQWYLFTEL